MSLESWEAEYILPYTDWASALEASIKKWEGLLPVNREKHDVHVVHGSLTDGRDWLYQIRYATQCPLCHMDENGVPLEYTRVLCNLCPLGKVDPCMEGNAVWWDTSDMTTESITAMIDKLKEARNL